MVLAYAWVGELSVLFERERVTCRRLSLWQEVAVGL
jgi:hypothetical protein